MNNSVKQKSLLFNWDDFGGLDDSEQFEFLQGSLKAMDAQASNQKIQQHIIEKMQLKAGDHVLEVGCGLGLRAKRIAQSCSSQVVVTAVDKSEKIIALAKEMSAAENIHYTVDDAKALSFPDKLFDVVTAERLLICFDDALPVLKEMIRVLKPGGLLVITDFDPASILITPADQVMHQIFMNIYMPSFADIFIGRKLPMLFKTAGLTILDVILNSSDERDITHLEKIIPLQQVLEGGVRAEVLAQEQAQHWHADLRRASRDGTFLYAITVVSMVGIKGK